MLTEKAPVIRNKLGTSDLIVDVSDLSFEVPLGGVETQTKSFTITNPSKNLPATFSVVSSDGKLTLTPTSGTLAPGEMVTVDVSLMESKFQGPLSGPTQNFTGTIEVADGESKKKSISTDVVVTAGSIAASPSSLTIIVPPDDVGSVELTLSNSGPARSVVQFSIVSNNSLVEVRSLGPSTQRIEFGTPVKYKIQVNGRGLTPDNIPQNLKLIVKNLDIVSQPSFEIPVEIVLQEDIRGTYQGFYDGPGTEFFDDKGNQGSRSVTLSGRVTIAINKASTVGNVNGSYTSFEGTMEVTGIAHNLRPDDRKFFSLCNGKRSGKVFCRHG